MKMTVHNLYCLISHVKIDSDRTECVSILCAVTYHMTGLTVTGHNIKQSCVLSHVQHNNLVVASTELNSPSLI